MLTKAGAKLLNFGLAKLRPPGPVRVFAPTMSADLTGEGAILGTLQYIGTGSAIMSVLGGRVFIAGREDPARIGWDQRFAEGCSACRVRASRYAAKIPAMACVSVIPTDTRRPSVLLPPVQRSAPDSRQDSDAGHGFGHRSRAESRTR